METHDPFDEELRKLVRSVELIVPPGIEEKVQAATASPPPHPRRIRMIRRPILLGPLSAAAVVLLAYLLVVPLFHGRQSPMITEIQTEFELADKNIKIIFVQKPEFPVLLIAY
jgi:hypothetical protein